MSRWLVGLVLFAVLAGVLGCGGYSPPTIPDRQPDTKSGKGPGRLPKD